MTAATPDLRERIRLNRSLPSPAACRALREAAGVSIADVAGEIGVTPMAVSFWERGERRPRGENLARYATVIETLRGAA